MSSENGDNLIRAFQNFAKEIYKHTGDKTNLEINVSKRVYYQLVYELSEKSIHLSSENTGSLILFTTFNHIKISCVK